MYLILFIGITIMSLLVQSNLKSKFRKYSKIRLSGGYTGKQVAEMMLSQHGINDVSVTCTDGMLTDHYNPANKTVNLSKDVYYGDSVMAAAVAAHECGHAVQHATAYAPLRMRSALVPAVNFSSSIVSWVLLIGIFTIQTFPQVMLAGIALFAVTTLFSFVTLPVEINASMRAVGWLERAHITDYDNHDKAVGALKAAAYTYVAAALGSLTTLIYYVLAYLGNRD